MLLEAQKVKQFMGRGHYPHLRPFPIVSAPLLLSLRRSTRPPNSNVQKFHIKCNKKYIGLTLSCRPVLQPADPHQIQIHHQTTMTHNSDKWSHRHVYKNATCVHTFSTQSSNVISRYRHQNKRLNKKYRARLHFQYFKLGILTRCE